MIYWLLNNILWGRGWKKASFILTVVFLGTWVSYQKCLHHASLEVIGYPLEMMTQPTVAHNSFHEGHYTDQNTPYKR